MTTQEALHFIGQTGRLLHGQGRDGLAFNVTVRDARDVFGRLDFYVTPTAGDGGAWVEAQRVRLDGSRGLVP